MRQRKQCRGCPRMFGPRPGEREYDWMRRAFHSRTCFHRSRYQAGMSRTCEACGAEFHRSRGEEAGNFVRRRACSPRCQQVLRGKAFMHMVHGVKMTTHDLATMLGQSAAAIRQRKMRGRSLLGIR